MDEGGLVLGGQQLPLLLVEADVWPETHGQQGHHNVQFGVGRLEVEELRGNTFWKNRENNENEEKIKVFQQKKTTTKFVKEDLKLKALVNIVFS